MRIGAVVIDETAIENLISMIKQKKELRELSEEFIRHHLHDYFSKRPAMVMVLDTPRSEKYKRIVKDIRAFLRRVYGLFRIEKGREDIRGLLKEFSTAGTIQQKKILEIILSTHSSTKERLLIYAQLYPQLWKITGRPSKILDLGCGLNPFSLPLMGLRSVQYYGYDLSMEEVSLLRDFFILLHRKNSLIRGEAAVFDLLHSLSERKLPAADVCFLFKMTDVLDQGKGHKKTEELLKHLSCRFVVVSFATKTMSGKKMTAPRRSWMEWLCNRLGWKFTIVEMPDELFYVIEKN
ncbi:hypothetical protein HYT55_05025 [Candidatus Woesearchaeota archaeon]|nr:hypothetical protein [Candidatus Woesearchaeota archaeon]